MDGRNIFKGILNPSYKPSRNAFDLSQRHVTSLKAGALLPVCCVDYIPGDYFEINMQDLVRTMPLNTAAFLRAKLHFDWYAVPYRQLWSRFNQFAVTRRDLTSAMQVNLDVKYQPQVLLGDLFAAVNGLPTAGVQNRFDGKRLLDSLGYGNFDYSGMDNAWKNKSVSPFRLAAYQKIWHDYYRNPWRDIPIPEEVTVYNYDDLICSNIVNNLVSASSLGSLNIRGTSNPTDRLIELVSLRYRGWKKDIYMGSLPDSQFGAVSTVPLDLSGVSFSGITGSDRGRWDDNGSSLPSNQNVATDSSNNLRTPTSDKIQHDHVVSGISVSTSYHGSFDILSLRYATALQKWRENVMRAGYRTKYQFEAQFGVSDPHDSYDMAIHVGSTSTQIGIDEVVSTAQTTNGGVGAALGDIAGKGIGVGKHSMIKFDSNGTYGVLMCLASIIPESEYDSFALDKNVRRLEFDDYYQPMFDNLGLEPIIAPDLNANYTNPTNINSVIGYAPRNWEYKTAVDKVHLPVYKSDLKHWVHPRADLEAIVNTGNLRVIDYYINPGCLDPLFLGQINGGTPDWSFDTDQFLLNVSFFISAVRNMSVLGLPQW